MAAPIVPAMSSSAGAVQLHELLFGQRTSRRAERVTPQPAAQPSPAAPPVRKVRGPLYYTYKPAALDTVTFASLLPKPAEINPLEPSLDFEASRFNEALALVPDGTLTAEKDVIAAIKAQYAAHPAFIWSRGNNVTDDAKKVVALLDAAGEHGLSTSEYAVAVPPDGWSMDDPAGRTAKLLAFDIALSTRAARYAMDMKDGEVNPNKLSGYHDFPLPRMTAKDAIESMASADDPAAWLRTLEPQQPEYAALKRELATLKAQHVDEVVLPEKLLLKPGGSDEALPQIMKALRKHVSDDTRAKHAATFAEYLAGTDYSEDIVAIVRDYQKDNGLGADGIIGPRTLGKLTDETQASKVERVELALERLRWHPEHFGSRHVLINQPAFNASYFVDGKVALSTRAIVGKKSNQTSFFFDEIETVVYNPYWGVPQSIIVNEMLPKLYRDPSYFDRNGYEVVNASGQRVSSSSVNWHDYSTSRPYSVRQKPGPSNALGDVKILFPNKHDIYMHDTPSRSLFERDQRALSHGCVRLQEPREMAAALLGKSVDYVSSRIGGKEQAEKVPTKIPVFISYYTAWPSTDGTVHYYSDIYDRDVFLEKAIEAVHKARESTAS